jgi:hypothetical protein
VSIPRPIPAAPAEWNLWIDHPDELPDAIPKPAWALVALPGWRQANAGPAEW